MGDLTVKYMKFDLKQSLENAYNLRLPKEFKVMDHINKMILAGIPLAVTPVPPDDQSPCIKEMCDSCGELMWVSEKKRNHRANKPNIEIYCVMCVIASMKIQGFKMQDIEIFDISKLEN